MTLGLGAAGAAGAAVLAASGAGSGTVPAGAAVQSAAATSPARAAATRRYRSRPDLDAVRITVAGPGRTGAGTAPGYLLLTPGGPLIVDDAGEPIWIHHVPHASTDLKVQRYNGQPVLTWWQGTITHYGVGQQGECMMLDSSYRQIRRVVAGNGLQVDLHEFLIAPTGIGYITAYREVRRNLSAVGGPTNGRMLDAVIQGINLATGAVVFEWHSADHIDITESHQQYGKPPYDPVHLNSIELTQDGHLLLSARNTWALYKVDPASGDIVWRLGGKRSDFRLGRGVRFAWQHDAREHPGGVISLFDDEATPAEAGQSRGLFIHVDEQRRRATFIRQYRHPRQPVLAGSQGSVQLLPNGNVLVGWGAEPYYTEYTQRGRLVLDGTLATGESYRAYRFPWTGTPAAPPDIAVERKGTNQVTVYASWNGATEVASWAVLAGSDPQALTPIGAARRSGFETAIRVRTTAPYVAAQALDSAQHVLGTSVASKA